MTSALHSVKYQRLLDAREQFTLIQKILAYHPAKSKINTLAVNICFDLILKLELNFASIDQVINSDSVFRIDRRIIDKDIIKYLEVDDQFKNNKMQIKLYKKSI
ncbi:hypothetical protein BpHYR1_040286 [Brachionus plicatilis]|uniref:Uncharacterized protein n=1 Tax=Brachionus plicatilis TaxID=10195 RepID=A0A3M7R858_BRAPC|nr:hypothetical protein BpHYR1_040286 [Brachionus plicatilis]